MAALAVWMFGIETKGLALESLASEAQEEGALAGPASVGVVKPTNLR